jgi:hypothetical protein
MNTKKKFAKIVLWARIFRFYKNGSGFGFVWNWINPLSWIFAPTIFLTSCVLYGTIETWKERHSIGFGIDPYFKSNPSKLVWVKRKL